MKEAAESQHNSTEIPLCVDLDGTLITTDLLFETVFRAVQHNPFLLFLLPLWLLRGGRARLKDELALRTSFSAEALPYNEELRCFLQSAREGGRPLYLVTASNQRLADEIGVHYELFDEVIGSDRTRNLKGKHKATYLVERFGEAGFDYVGNSRADFPVWGSARYALVASPSKSFIASVKATFEVREVFACPPVTLGLYLRQLRVHQWVKNLLLFVPAIMSHQLIEPAVFWQTLGGFFAFSTLASSVYILNDLVDLEVDRRHHKKRFRPFASGVLPLHHGFLMVPCLWLLAGVFCSLIPLSFLTVLAAYFLITTCYSFALKRIPVVDIITLASLYTIRVFAGGMAATVIVSPWLLAFSLFMFMSLACAKRFSELYLLRGQNAGVVPGRGYVPDDLEMIGQCGIAAGYMSVLVLALYINSDVVVNFYRSPGMLWLLCPVLLYWVTRVWLIAHRGNLHEDPIVFAIKDRVSYGVAALSALCLYFAL